MRSLHALALGCFVLGAACTGQEGPGAGSATVSLGPPVVREGTVYTPVGVGAQGCVLYNIRVPGGQAPAAMAYQGADGSFSYGRPDPCVKPVDAR